MTDEDPTRLAAGPDSLMKSLIEDGRKELASPTQLAAVAAKLGPILGGGGGPGGGGPGPPHPGGAAATKIATTGLATKVGLAALGIATLATILRVMTAPEPAALPGASPAGSSSAEPRAYDPLAALPDPTTAPEDPSTLPPSDFPIPSGVPWHGTEAGVPPPLVTAAPTLGADLRLLTEAQQSLGAEPAKALSLCNEHAKRFPTSKFAQERETLAVVALVSLGRTEEAQKRADAFKTTYPDSPNIRRLERILSSP